MIIDLKKFIIRFVTIRSISIGIKAMARYFISEGNEPDVEVTKAKFVAIERREGFHDTMGEPDEPATAGFGSNRHGEGIAGRIVWDRSPVFSLQ